MPRGTQDLRWGLLTFVYGAVTLSDLTFQNSSTSHPTPVCGSSNPDQLAGRFGLLPFRSPLLGKSSLFLGVLRCFSSPRSPRPGYVFTWRYAGIPPRGFPHSDIPGCSRLHTAHRGFSQCTTSFVGS